MRSLVFIALIVCSGVAQAATVDDVLKQKTASAEQLDEAAQDLLNQEVGPTKKAATPVKAGDVATERLKEDQIPVFRDEKKVESQSSASWTRLLLSAVFLIAVAGVLVLTARRVAKRRNIGGTKAKIEVLHQHFLGPKKSLALIQVAGEAILIGVTDHNISMIKQVALIDDELPNAEFSGFLDEAFTVESLTAQKSRSRIV